MIDPNDMEDPQAGEVLPPMLYEAYWSNDDGSLYASCAEDRAFKAGMEFCFQLLQSYLKAALPYYEAGVIDTRLGQADAGKLAELARYKEIAEYEK